MNEADPNINVRSASSMMRKGDLRKHDEKRGNQFVSKKAIIVTQCKANNRFK